MCWELKTVLLKEQEVLLNFQAISPASDLLFKNGGKKKKRTTLRLCFEDMICML